MSDPTQPATQLSDFETFVAARTAPVAQDAPQAPVVAEPASAPAAAVEAAPGPAEATAEAVVDEAPAAAADPAVALAPVATFVGGPARTKTVQLTYPVAYAGAVYAAIVLSRPTAAQVGTFFEKLAATIDNDEFKVRFPVFFDTDGRPVPDAVMDALDDDDAQEVLRDASDFLPKRLRAMTEASSGSAPVTGADTGPTSAA